MQTSIAAWLQKPTAVKEPPRSHEISNVIQEAKQAPSGLPTPPLEEPEKEQARNDLQQRVIQLHDTSRPPKIRKARPLHPNLTLTQCTKALLPGLKRLNSLLLPIPYPSKFFEEIFTDPLTASITLVALWSDVPSAQGPKPPTASDAATDTASTQRTGKVVGGIRCRLLPSTSLASTTTPTPRPVHQASASEEEKMLYISTLAVLSPYQTHGIATHLLETVLERAINRYGVSAVGAHVCETNTEAREWYRKRGFVEVRREEGYYRRLGKAAVVLRRAVDKG